MKGSVDRVLTTHAGSLPRPADLLAMSPSQDPAACGARVRRAIAEMVRRQTETGLDVVTDGEMRKPSFITYVAERLSGFEPSPQSTVVVEHPELVAERIVRFAGVVGRERVVAGADCGFASFAGSTEIHPSIVWAKLAALTAGAALASRRLWGR